jgi:hypothetical protein
MSSSMVAPISRSAGDTAFVAVSEGGDDETWRLKLQAGAWRVDEITQGR